MKNITRSFMVILLLLVTSGTLFAQAELQTTGVPYKTPNSVLYGSDVIIDDQPSQDQRNTCLSVAFNGWLYACNSVYDGTAWSWKIFRSVDDGATWTVVRDQALNTDWIVKSLDIVVTGLTESDLRIFIARILQNNTSGSSELIVSQLDAASGGTLVTLRDNLVTGGDLFQDVAIASDYKFPAVGASPFSVAVLYSKYNASTDSIRILTSADGGASITGEQLITSTAFYVRNVSLAYGRCWNYFNGRYFAAWEERNGSGDDLGQIWTAHSVTFFGDPFTTPLRIENLIGATENWAKNPSISCQFNDTDNELLNLTEVVLFERAYNGNLSDFDVVGLYNKEAANTDNWSIFGMAASSDYEIQPDINFDPGFNNFLAVYCNYTTQKLRYVVMGMNMPDPYNWWVINDQFNDNTNLFDPYPKVEINPIYTQVAHVWTGEGPGGGVTTYDAEYSHLGISGSSAKTMAVSVTPNPAQTQAVIRITSTEASQVTIRLYTLQGKDLGEIGNAFCQPGTNAFQTDVSALPEGCYIFRVTAGDHSGTGRLIVTR